MITFFCTLIAAALVSGFIMSAVGFAIGRVTALISFNVKLRKVLRIMEESLDKEN